MTFSKRISAIAALLIALSALAPIAAHGAECTPEVTSDGARTVVAFKTIGTCTWSTPQAATTFRGLIVGGGGGGFVEFESLTATNDVFTIVVGGGGVGSTSLNYAGDSGGNSSLSGNSLAIIARGGAGGGSYSGSTNAPARGNGGSGGGAATGSTSSNGGPNSNGTQTSQAQTPTLSAITGSQFGFNGGTRSTVSGSGGGGAGADGVSGGAGGAGRANSILGAPYIWAGGGGGNKFNNGNEGGTGGGGGGGAYTGGGYIGGTGGTGGINPGSQGQTGCAGGSGGANTGGGGGGGANCGGGISAGGAGGSGIVILSYIRVTSPALFSLQLSGGMRSAIFRSTSTIEAVVPANGRVSFYQFGKPIAGCARRATSGASPNIKATCSWMPSTRGSVNISAIYTPSNINFATARIDNFQVAIGNRASLR